MTQEESRLQEARKGTSNWKKWGPYVSDPTPANCTSLECEFSQT